MDEESGDRPPVKVPRVLDGAAAWSWRILVIAAAVAVAVLVLIKLYVVVVPVVLALFLASVLEPLAARLRRHGWPASLAAVTVFVGALGVILAALVWIGASVASQFDDLGRQIDRAVDDAKEWAQGEPLQLVAGEGRRAGVRGPGDRPQGVGRGGRAGRGPGPAGGGGPRRHRPAPLHPVLRDEGRRPHGRLARPSGSHRPTATTWWRSPATPGSS